MAQLKPFYGWIIAALDKKTKEVLIDAKIVKVDLSDIPPELWDTYEDSYSTLEADFSILEDLADKTGGEAYLITNEYELEEAFRLATQEQTAVDVNTAYFITILIAVMSIFELIFYARFGALQKSSVLLQIRVNFFI